MHTSLVDADGHHAHISWSGVPARAGRGLYRAVTVLTLFAMLFGGLMLMAPASASAQTQATTTANLNFRTGPSLDDSIIAVIPSGTAVRVTGDPVNGFYPLEYNGWAGYASADYLTFGGSPSEGGGSGSVPVGDTVVGTATVVDGALNLRSGPGTSYQVLTVMPDRASVEIMGDPQAGFYPVRYNGTKGWASADWLSIGGAAAPSQPAPSSPGSVPVGDTVVGSASVTSSLNLRTGPSTDYEVVLVMPYGASVEVMGEPQNGFYPLRYKGTKGWASGQWLNVGGGNPSPSKPAPSGESDIVSIIYAAADRYGQPREDMLRVARCESNLDPSAVNPHSGASGLFQFMPGTWATTPYADQNIFDATANANAAGWMWSVGRRNEWTCQ